MVLLLWVVEESLSVYSSSLLHLVRMLELRAKREIIWVLPLVINNAITRVVAHYLVESGCNFLVSVLLLHWPLQWTILLLDVTLQFLLLRLYSSSEVVWLRKLRDFLVVINVKVIADLVRVLLNLQVGWLSRIESLVEALLRSLAFAADCCLLLLNLIGLVHFIIWGCSHALLELLFRRCIGVVSTLRAILLF